MSKYKIGDRVYAKQARIYGEILRTTKTPTGHTQYRVKFDGIDTYADRITSNSLDTELNGLIYDAAHPQPTTQAEAYAQALARMDAKEGGRPAIYPYDTWFDGLTHEIHKGRDYECATESMRAQLVVAATKHNLKVVVQVYRYTGQGSIVFRSYAPTADGKRPIVSSQAAANETGKDAKYCLYEGCGKVLTGNDRQRELGECSAFPPSAEGYVSEHTGKLLGW
jgi:hypothetical protein